MLIHTYLEIKIIAIWGNYLGTQYIEILQPEYKSVVELCFLMHKYIQDSNMHVK